MKIVDEQLFRTMQRFYCFPDPGAGRLNDKGLPIVELPTSSFSYDPDVGYAFETAVMQRAGEGQRLLFVRIDAWDPAYRSAGGEVDYCIPLAYEGASEREQLGWKVPFAGAWSDTREAALLVFDSRWEAFFWRIGDRLAFANPGARSAALFCLQARDRQKLSLYLGGC